MSSWSMYYNPDTKQYQDTPPPNKVANLAINQANKDLAGMPSLQQQNSLAQQAADPFASQRGGYQNSLSNMMNGKFSTSDPSYQWRVDQGSNALQRSAAAKGYLGSGNILTALSDYGQNQGSQEFQNQYQRLLPLTGAMSGSPGAAGNIANSLIDRRNSALASLGGGMAMNGQGGSGGSSSSLNFGTSGPGGGGRSGGGGGGYVPQGFLGGGSSGSAGGYTGGNSLGGGYSDNHGVPSGYMSAGAHDAAVASGQYGGGGGSQTPGFSYAPNATDDQPSDVPAGGNYAPANSLAAGGQQQGNPSANETKYPYSFDGGATHVMLTQSQISNAIRTGKA